MGRFFVPCNGYNELTKIPIGLITYAYTEDDNHYLPLCLRDHRQFDRKNYSKVLVKHMKKVKITALRRACYPDLMAKYENPIQHTCDVEEGMSWLSVDGEKPDNFCDSAWDSMAYFVKELAGGGGNFYDGWMKNPHSAMISCNDGFRPVSFYIEVVE